MKQTLANERSDSRQADRPTESREENEEGGHGGRQRDQMPKDGKRDGDGAGDGGGWGGKKAQPVARHSNLCMSKQDSQIYEEEVRQENKEEGSPNVILKPSHQHTVQICHYTQACGGLTGDESEQGFFKRMLFLNHANKLGTTWLRKCKKQRLCTA